jgi:ornithine carbamoyltransferase
MTHFTTIADCTYEQLRHYLDVAIKLKRQYQDIGRNDSVLAGKTLAMIFEKMVSAMRPLSVVACPSSNTTDNGRRTTNKGP